MTLNIVPSGGACGATIRGVDLAKPLSRDVIAAIRTAFLAHQVLAFPDQDMTDDDLERFTLAFGSFGEDPFIAPIPGRAHVLEVRREADEKTPLFAESWHSDWSFLDTPPAATILYGVEIPPVGGDTLFSNQYAAYEALDDATKQKLDGLMGVHSARRGYARDGLYGDGDKGRSMAIRPSDAALKTRLHPIVRRHPETGRTALFANMGYTIGVDGMNDEDATALLWPLFKHSIKDEFVFAQSWTPGQLVMWDNRCVNHRATGGYEGHRRVLHRTTVAG
jgi:taurine dioxygenase